MFKDIHFYLQRDLLCSNEKKIKYSYVHPWFSLVFQKKHESFFSLKHKRVKMKILFYDFAYFKNVCYIFLIVKYEPRSALSMKSKVSPI